MLLKSLLQLLAMGALCIGLCQTGSIWEPEDVPDQSDNADADTLPKYGGASASGPEAKPAPVKRIRTGILADPVRDIDGNVYQTVRIGNQVWTKTNLKATRYNDGSPIRFIADPWDSSGEFLGLHRIGAPMCRDNAMTYAAKRNKKKSAEPWLEYNWHVVKSGKLAPAGWRVPSCAQWDTLARTLRSGGYDYETVFGGNYMCDSSVSEEACGEYGGSDRFWWSGDSCAENPWEYWRHKAVALRLSPGEDVMSAGPEVKTLWYPVRLVKEATK
jgi:uncharacterized protein (TIGR02145 family)